MYLDNGVFYLNSVLLIYEENNKQRHYSKIESIDWFVLSQLEKKNPVVVLHHSYFEEFVV
jgi:hypothetical protein